LERAAVGRGPTPTGTRLPGSAQTMVEEVRVAILCDEHGLAVIARGKPVTSHLGRKGRTRRRCDGDGSVSTAGNRG